jgi:hypothetical protein
MALSNIENNELLNQPKHDATSNPIISRSRSKSSTLGSVRTNDISSSQGIETAINVQLQPQIDALVPRIVELEKSTNRIDKEQNKVIETIGLFIGLFTFVSVSFQAFATVKEFNQLISILFISGGLILMVLATFFVFSRKFIGEKFSWSILLFYLICVALMCTGLWYSFYSDNKLIERCYKLSTPADCIIKKEDIEKIIQPAKEKAYEEEIKKIQKDLNLTPKF